jgi:hypothetical protein
MPMLRMASGLLARACLQASQICCRIEQDARIVFCQVEVQMTYRLFRNLLHIAMNQ